MRRKTKRTIPLKFLPLLTAVASPAAAPFRPATSCLSFDSPTSFVLLLLSNSTSKTRSLPFSDSTFRCCTFSRNTSMAFARRSCFVAGSTFSV